MEIGYLSMSRLQIQTVDVRIYFFVKPSKVGATSCVLMWTNIFNQRELHQFIHLLRFPFEPIFLFWPIYQQLEFILVFSNFAQMTIFFGLFWFLDNVWLLRGEQPLSYTIASQSVRLHHLQRLLNNIGCFLFCMLINLQQWHHSKSELFFFLSFEFIQFGWIYIKKIGLNVTILEYFCFYLWSFQPIPYFRSHIPLLLK